MDTNDYRARFASFNSESELARYHQHVGLTSNLTLVEINNIHSDLFSRTALAEVEAQLQQTPLHLETERVSLTRLLGWARRRFADAQAVEVTRELRRCEQSSIVPWKGETISNENEACKRLASEAERQPRREIAVRWADAISKCNDLRLAYLARLNDAAVTLQYQSFYDLVIGNDRPIFSTTTIESVLEQTESSYSIALSRLLTEEFPSLRPNELSFADLPRITGLSWLDHFFNGPDLFRCYVETMRGLGVRVDQQKAIRNDTDCRPTRKRRAACFPVAPPADVRLAILQDTGTDVFLNGLECFGKAQYYAWCSQNLADRNPEFVYSQGTGTSHGFGFLFRFLLLDTRWIAQLFPHLNESQSESISKNVGFLLALQTRTLCAATLYEQSVFNEIPQPEELQSTYVRLNEEATLFKPLPELYLTGLQIAERPATQLRALAFAFGLREHLRMRYGHQWWTSRKAGDELIDLWSTSSRHSVEELSLLLGFGELSFELLADVINTELTRKK